MYDLFILVGCLLNTSLTRRRWAVSDKKNIFLTSKKQTWETPQALFDHLARWFSFNLDPCAEPETTKCDRFFTEEDNGLKQDWGDNSVVFVNPPYRDSKLWLKKSRAVSGTSNTDIVFIT
jgi:phage N-6-adenine-methyltransferase